MKVEILATRQAYLLTSEILLPGGVKSQSTLLFRGDTNSNNLPDFERDALQKDSVSEKKFANGDLSCSTSKKPSASTVCPKR